jgi:hypothetical protein
MRQVSEVPNACPRFAVTDAADDGVEGVVGGRVGAVQWVHALVCERESAIGTNFFTTGEECLVGLLVSNS